MPPSFLCFLTCSVPFLLRNNMGKRRRLAEDEEHAAASPEITVHPQPLVLLALLKSALDFSVCRVSGAILLSFARLCPAPSQALECKRHHPQHPKPAVFINLIARILGMAWH
jgi:hypothetical protein